MERTVAQGGVSGRDVRDPAISSLPLAGRGDDADIRRLLRENATDGWIRLALAREPDAFAAAAVMGRAHAYVIARSRQSGEAVGVCEWSVREAFVDGGPGRSPISARCGSRQPIAIASGCCAAASRWFASCCMTGAHLARA